MVVFTVYPSLRQGHIEFTRAKFIHRTFSGQAVKQFTSTKYLHFRLMHGSGTVRMTVENHNKNDPKLHNPGLAVPIELIAWTGKWVSYT